MRNNKRVRGILVESGIVPENLPPEEDLKKLGRIVKKDEKRIAAASRLKKSINRKNKN